MDPAYTATPRSSPKSHFVSVISREKHDDELDEVLLETNGSIEHWLVYRRWQDVDRALVEPIGDAWAEIERVQVAVAVPLDPAGKPSTDTLFPLHVYFPTEEATGLPIIAHGDFALQLDRRQLGTNPEAIPYNETLLDVIAGFLATKVAPDLAHRYPDDISSVAAVTPRSPATGMGQRCMERCIDQLRSSRFLPSVDGQFKIAAEALLLPDGVGDAERAHRHLDLRGVGRLLIAGAEQDPTIRKFLKNDLNVAEWPLDETLGCLTEPGLEERSDFYELLVEWSEGFGNRTFTAMLANAPCVVTTSGAWVAPSLERVFFPRQRDDIEVPSDLPVPIADLPQVDGLLQLLGAAGVREFEWRELMRDYLLPLLTSEDTDPVLRQRAMRGLRSYHASQRTGDPVLQRRIREVLLPATDANGLGTALRAAGSLYFTSAWTGTRALETLYGPFDEIEFLATDPPEDSDERSSEATFLRWMGVADHPRVLVVRAEQRDTYMTSSLWRHPHRTSKAWDDWWNTPEVQEASRCPQDHPSSQRLQASYLLDRFDDLSDNGDVSQLLTLWTELARNWGTLYEPATRALFHCQHSAHGGERERAAPSLLWHLLADTAWIPALKGDHVQQVRPADAWRLAFDTPKWIAKRVPIIDSKMLEGPGLSLAMTLGVTDAARPAPADLCELLEELYLEYEASGVATREVQIAARWAMRTLNDVLAESVDNEVLTDVPLLARFKGEPIFTTDPVVATDPLLAETWEGHYPILDADRDLRRLHEALGLKVLDDPEHGVRVTPVPQGVREDLQEATAKTLAKTKPYLAAVAIANTPSREEDVIRGLKRLELTACTNLVLRYTFEGTTIDREEATSYIAVRQETIRGAARRNIGTAHLEIDPQSRHADWYAFGPQLAQFLQVPTQGDAFAMLLTGSDDDRDRYLASRRIPLESVDQMRVALDLPIEDEFSDELFDFLDEGASADPDDPESTGPPTDEHETEPEPGSDLGGDNGSGDRADEPLPSIDADSIVMQDADPGAVEGRKGGTGGGGGGLGPAGPVDHEGSDRRQREIGDRGEEAAYKAERRRVEAAGFDPNAVVWLFGDERGVAV